MAPYGYEYKQTRSSQAVQWSGNFNSTIPFIFKTDTNRWVKPRECYLAVKLRIVQTNAALDQLTLRPISDANGNITCYPYIVKNPLGVLWNQAKCLINDKLISNMNEVSATNTLYKTIYDTRTMQETIESTNPIFCQSLTTSAPGINSVVFAQHVETITAASTSAVVFAVGQNISGVTVHTAVSVYFAAGAADADVKTTAQPIVISYNNYYFTYSLPIITFQLVHNATVTVPSITIILPIMNFPNRATYAQKCQLMFNTFNEMTLTCALPLPLFQSNEFIPPHTKVEIDLNVNPNWVNEIIGLVGAAPAGGIVQLASATNTVANSIGVGVDDIVLWTYNVHDQTPINITKEIHLKQYFSQIHTISSSNDNFILSLPNGGRNITHIFACFLQKNRGTVKCSSNDFSDGYTNAYPEVKSVSGAVSTLQMIRFQLDKMYPNPDYDLNMSNALGDSCKDVSRAFYDFINNADAKFDRSGNVISIQEWINEPLFVFKCNTEATSYNETLQVSIRLDTSYTPSYSQMLVCVLYDETVRLTYDSEKCVATDLVL